MTQRMTIRAAVIIVMLVFACWASNDVAAQTRKGAIRIESLHCQVAPNGQCYCGKPYWAGTGKNIPCIYGADRLICDADTSQSSAGGSTSQGETWDQKLTREIESAIESRATSPGFDHTQTQLKITISASGGWQRPGISGRTVRSDDYVRLADRVMTEFMNNGQTRPPDKRAHVITLILPASPSDASQSGDPSCRYVPGQPLQGKAEQKGTVDNNPPLSGGTDTTDYPPPQAMPGPTPQPQPVQVVYGKVLRRPAGQNQWFPISIQVPVNEPLNVYDEGPIASGPSGQYYTRFGGRLLKQWRPAQPGRAEVFGSFLIETLYTSNGGTETGVNMRVPLGSVPPP